MAIDKVRKSKAPSQGFIHCEIISFLEEILDDLYVLCNRMSGKHNVADNLDKSRPCYPKKGIRGWPTKEQVGDVVLRISQYGKTMDVYYIYYTSMGKTARKANHYCKEECGLHVASNFLKGHGPYLQNLHSLGNKSIQ